MKFSYLIFCILCLIGCAFSELKRETKHHIDRRSALVAEAVFSQLVETSSTLTTAYTNNELESAEDVALEFVDSIPILGDIVYLFTEDPDPSFDIESGLRTINNNLKILNANIETIGTRVNELSGKIDLSIIKNQVATDKREISNCYTDFLIFLQNPLSKAEQDRLKSCYSKFAYVRQIGNILINNKLTFMQQPIFDQIIGNTGYCDGEGLRDVFGFLLGLYIEGCTALITSEVLTYGNESTTYKDECKTTIQIANATLNEIFNNCKMESCNKFIHVMKNSLKADPASSIRSKLQTSFPWFYFVVVTLQKSISSGFTLHSKHIFNYLTLSSAGVAYRVLIWSSDTNIPDAGNYTYGIKFNENEVESIFDEIRLSNETTNGLTDLTGFRDDTTISKSYCNDDIDAHIQAGSDSDNEFEDFFNNDQDINISLPGWAIAVIVIVVVVVLLICVGICACEG